VKQSGKGAGTKFSSNKNIKFSSSNAKISTKTNKHNNMTWKNRKSTKDFDSDSFQLKRQRHSKNMKTGRKVTEETTVR
jgi:hypothetical protein